MGKKYIIAIFLVFILSGCATRYSNSESFRSAHSESRSLCSQESVREIYERLLENAQKCIEKNDINKLGRVFTEGLSRGIIKPYPKNIRVSGSINDSNTIAKLLVATTGRTSVEHYTEIVKGKDCASKVIIYENKLSKLSLRTSEFISKWVEEKSNQCD